MINKYVLHAFCDELSKEASFINKAKNTLGNYIGNLTGSRVKAQTGLVNKLKGTHQNLVNEYDTISKHIKNRDADVRSFLEKNPGGDLRKFYNQQEGASQALANKLNVPNANIKNGVDPGGLQARLYQLGSDKRFHFTRMGDDVDLINKAKNKATAAESSLPDLIKARNKSRLVTGAGVGTVGLGVLSQPKKQTPQGQQAPPQRGTVPLVRNAVKKPMLPSATS